MGDSFGCASLRIRRWGLVGCCDGQYSCNCNIVGRKDDILLPVRCPSNGYLLLVSWNAVEELTCVVVLAEVGDSSCTIGELEVCAIEFAREVLGYRAA